MAASGLENTTTLRPNTQINLVSYHARKRPLSQARLCRDLSTVGIFPYSTLAMPVRLATDSMHNIYESGDNFHLYYRPDPPIVSIRPHVGLLSDSFNEYLYQVSRNRDSHEKHGGSYRPS
jgi:hypothetical protein